MRNAQSNESEDAVHMDLVRKEPCDEALSESDQVDSACQSETLGTPRDTSTSIRSRRGLQKPGGTNRTLA
ncbi:hypothetical protein CEXT_309291 [Caerostris extrusa]|uniref:Uncharacterized protein n=1 Tax=Caerostris extrusa TaxID=172846 RepID=A0AAV4R7H3_CAEEX|nr:hypothetical protein CEXT_309291 [Caerostris extrusa]